MSTVEAAGKTIRSTIPARLYNDPVYLALERDRVFANTWQLVARADQL